MITKSDKVIITGVVFAGFGFILAVTGFDLFISGVIFGMGLFMVLIIPIYANRNTPREIDLEHKESGNGRDK